MNKNKLIEKYNKNLSNEYVELCKTSIIDAFEMISGLEQLAKERPDQEDILLRSAMRLYKYYASPNVDTYRDNVTQRDFYKLCDEIDQKFNSQWLLEKYEQEISNYIDWMTEDGQYIYTDGSDKLEGGNENE